VTTEKPISSAPVVPLDEILHADPNGDGVHWTLEADGDLNVNLVHLDPGSGVETHVNRELDVVVIVLEGNGRLRLDGTDHALAPHVLALMSKGTERSISAGPHGLSYLTVHRRRSPLGITGSQG
jgi:quercetin dioxygenase-like cupin family protein